MLLFSPLAIIIGFKPVSNSSNTMPKLKMSFFCVTVPLKPSGAIYAEVPIGLVSMHVVSNCLAKPKSHNCKNKSFRVSNNQLECIITEWWEGYYFFKLLSIGFKTVDRNLQVVIHLLFKKYIKTELRSHFFFEVG